jgi:hypothetical protein
MDPIILVYVSFIALIFILAMWRYTDHRIVCLINKNTYHMDLLYQGIAKVLKEVDEKKKTRRRSPGRPKKTTN